MLIIYVDDFKMAGPKKSLSKGWDLLRKGLSIDEDSPIDSKGTTYLGCRKLRKAMTLADGTEVTSIVYDMKDFLVSCLEKYSELA